MGADGHTMFKGKIDTSIHDFSVAGMTSASNITSRDMRHNLRVIVHAFT
jgi:hypothetical protein